MNWPNLHELPAISQGVAFKKLKLFDYDQQIESLTQAGEPLIWLNSCAPHFKNHNLDRIAGGFCAWVVSHSTNQHSLELNPALYNDEFISTNAYLSPQTTMPTKWMQDQLVEANEQPTAKETTPGWFGYLGYSYNAHSLGIHQALKHQGELPRMAMGFATWVISVDHAKQTATLCWLTQHSLNINLIIDQWQTRPCSPLGTSQYLNSTSQYLKSHWRAVTSRSQYSDNFKAIQNFLAAGDTYQINLAQAFQADINADINNIDYLIYRQISQNNPNPYSAFVRTPWGSISCHSPELFLESAPLASIESTNRQAIRLTARPIKGTCARSSDPTLDEQLQHQLQNSAKNRAENIMIVDLLRNDLSRVSLAGSIAVETLCALETYPNIHHLVSTIHGQLKPNLTPLDAVISAFPGGSITGAPKRRAIEIIDQLEPIGRSVYCGSIGFWHSPEHCQFNIAIRTLVIENNQCTLWAGGGITVDSQALEEYQECFDKVHTITQALAQDFFKTHYYLQANTQWLIQQFRRCIPQMQGQQFHSFTYPGKTHSAAVMILIDLQDTLTASRLILTQRSAHLKHHAGQICFPGGRFEQAEDTSLLMTALRETEEELGISAEYIQVLGQVGYAETISGFHVTHFLGFTTGNYTITPSAEEVDTVLYLPLAAMLSPDHYLEETFSIEINQQVFQLTSYSIALANQRVWGSTGRALFALQTAFNSTL